jgi:hypothetical protein
MTTEKLVRAANGRPELFDGNDSRPRLSRLHHTRDGLQIGDDANVVPGVKKSLYLASNRSADFQDEPSAGSQCCMSLRKQASDDLGPDSTGKHGVARLKFADLQLNLILLRFANIRRVGDNEVQAGQIESVEQVRWMEVDSFLELMAGGVGAGDFERGSRYIAGVDFGVRKFFS